MTTLRIACTRIPTVLDRDQPLRLLQWENIDAHLQLYEPLLQYVGGPPSTADSTASKKLTSCVAEKFSRSADLTSYRFTLRRGIRSASGNELTALDVCWAWKRSLALGTVGAWIASNVGIGDDVDQCVRAVDKWTVEFVLPWPSTMLPHLLAVIVPTIFDHEEALSHATNSDPWSVDWLRSHSSGFGPYKTDKGCSDNDSFVLVANENYFRGTPWFDRIEYYEIPSAADRFAALNRHDVEVALDLDVEARQYGSFTVHSLPTTWRTLLGLNVRDDSLRNPELRRLILHAIPHHEILERAYGGNADPMTSCISNVVLGHRNVLSSETFDSEYARGLRRAIGDCPTLELNYHSDLSAFPRTAEIIQSALRDVGLDVVAREMDASEHSFRRTNGSMPMFLDSDGPITIDGRYALGHDVNPPLNGVFDFTGYHSDEIDRLLKTSVATTDSAHLAEILGHVQEIAVRDLPWIPIAQERFVFGIRDNIKGYRWYPLPRLRVAELHQ